MISEVTQYLDLPRSVDYGTGKAVLTVDEVIELVRLRDTIRALPHGARGERLRQLAERFGCTTRTLYRSMRGDVEIVRVGDYEAVYRTKGAKSEHPIRISAWRAVR